MPLRRKKVLNDSKLTYAFFNQAGSSLCPCCGDESHHYASKAVNSGDLDNGDTTSSSVPAIIGKEQYKKLTHARKQELQAAIDTQPAISKSQAVTQALQLAHKQITDAPAIDKQPQPTTAFNLDNLDEVAETYDRACSESKAEEERKMAKLTGVVGDLAVTSNDPDRSYTDRLAAELDINVWNIHSKLSIPLSSMVRQAQLFNIEKRFGCVEETYQALVNDDKKCSGEDVPAKLPLSFQHKWNDPSKLVEPASKPRKKKAKKRLAGSEAVDQIQRNIKLAIEEFQELKETISNAEKPIKLPDLPASFTYAGVPVPRDIPDDIRQRYFDAGFAYDTILGTEEFMGLQKEASEQFIQVREMLNNWANVSHEVWESSKRRIYELPLFREYEYTRNALQAMFYTASRQEVKIVQFHCSEEAPKLSLAMKEVLGLKSMSPEEFEKDWESRCLCLQNHVPSVKDMLAHMDEHLKESVGQDRPKTDWWQWLVSDSE